MLKAGADEGMAEMMADDVVANFDANHDGKVTFDELKAGSS